MPYIEREDGNVVGLLRWPQFDGQERLPEDHPEVRVFINRPAPKSVTVDELLDALDEVASTLPAEGRMKLDALLAKRTI